MNDANTSSTTLGDVMNAASRLSQFSAASTVVRLDLSRAAYEIIRHRAQCERDDESPFLRLDGLPWIVDDALPDMAIVWRYADGSARPMILSTKGGA